MKNYIYMDMTIKWSGKKWMIYNQFGNLFGSEDSIPRALRMIKRDALSKEVKNKPRELDFPKASPYSFYRRPKH